MITIIITMLLLHYLPLIIFVYCLIMFVIGIINN